MSLPARVVKQPESGVNRCRSCGVTLPDRRRKYCEPGCKTQMQSQLKFGAGLLRAIETQLAALHWTDRLLVLQVLPFNAVTVHCFLWTRSPRKKPASDFARFMYELGERWWAIHDAARSNRKRAATELLEEADAQTEHTVFAGAKTPSKPKPVGVAAQHLTVLDVAAADLLSDDADRVLKDAYRKSAIAAHPDHGGSDDQFIRVKAAFDQLTVWLRDPKLMTTYRTGLPDRWLFDGSSNTWHAPQK